MALLFMDGFDAGDVVTKWSSVAGMTPSASTFTRFGTGRSLLTPAGSGGQWSSATKRLPASSTLILGVAFNCNYMGANQAMIILSGDDGLTPHLSLSFNGANGALILYRGNYATQIATSPADQIEANGWAYLEVMATINDTSGICKVRCNGVTVIDFVGDTKNGGTNTTLDTLTLHSAVYGNNGWYYYWDDLYICDGTGSAPYNTFLGDVRVATLSPNGAGSSTQFAPSTGTNYQAVDELPYSASDYVSATTSGTRDTYAMSDLTGSYSVLGVQNNVIAKKTDAGGTALKSAIVSGGTTYYGPSTILTPTDVTITDVHTTNPATSAAWTIADVNGLEAGMEIA